MTWGPYQAGAVTSVRQKKWRGPIATRPVWLTQEQHAWRSVCSDADIAEIHPHYNSFSGRAGLAPFHSGAAGVGAGARIAITTIIKTTVSASRAISVQATKRENVTGWRGNAYQRREVILPTAASLPGLTRSARSTVPPRTRRWFCVVRP